MKQMTEAELRAALTKAYDEGARLSKAHRYLKVVTREKHRDELIETIIQSL